MGFNNLERLAALGGYMENIVWATKIRNITREYRISQMELSEYLDCSQKTVSRYLTGETIPREDVKLRIEEYISSKIPGGITLQANNIQEQEVLKVYDLDSKEVHVNNLVHKHSTRIYSSIRSMPLALQKAIMYEVMDMIRVNKGSEGLTEVENSTATVLEYLSSVE